MSQRLELEELLQGLDMLEKYFDEKTTLEDVQSLSTDQLMLMVNPKDRRYVFELEKRLHSHLTELHSEHYLELASKVKPVILAWKYCGRRLQTPQS
jgi:hypothetical protein